MEQGTPDKLPQRIGKYRVDAVAGRGAMGVVYKGYDETIERVVAIKTVRGELLAGYDADDWLARFRQEARAAARCLHPNVVAVFDYVEEQGAPFIVMEYIQGRELKHYLQEKKVRFEPKTILFIINQVLSALEYAHASGIVHRDIKPGNIIILEDGHVKVADFGIARTEAPGLTQVGLAVGTPGYMSPEQFMGGAVDHRTDLYSVGVVLFELLTGQRPFSGRSTTEIMYKVLHQAPQELAGLTDRPLPAGLEAVIHKALARDLAQRFQSATQFAAALREVMASSSPSLPPAAVPVPASQDTRLLDTGELPWPPDLLHQVEERLAYYIGPLAKLLVKKAALHCHDLESLYQTLARHLEDEGERAAFLRGAKATGGGATGITGTSGTSGGTDDAGLDPQVLDTAQHRLAEYLGPIAKVLVKKAARRAGSVDDLYRRLAEHLDDPAERAAFLKGKR